MKVTTLGIDLAKNVFQLHGVNEFGKPVIKKQIRREQMTEFFVNLSDRRRSLHTKSGCMAAIETFKPS